MDDDDDFTFPTVAAARGPTVAPEGQPGRRDHQDTTTVPHLLQLPALPNLAAGASPLWPFAGSVPKTTATATTTAPSSFPSPSPPAADDEQEQAHVPVLGGSRRTERSAATNVEGEGYRVAADDEDRMDLLWEAGTPTTTAAAARPIAATAPSPAESRSAAGHAGPPPPKQLAAAGDDDDDKRRAAALADAERMDKLWESFNDDLVLRHRDRDRARRAKSKSAAGISITTKVSRGGPDDDDGDRWYLCSYDSPSSGADDDGGESDDQGTGTSASSPAERRGYGCAPTMLRASSRAGGAGQFCAASPRARRLRRGGGGRGAAAGWALLLRLFRRLFAVDKTKTAPSPSPSSSRSHSSLYVP